MYISDIIIYYCFFPLAELIIKVTSDKPDKSGPRTLTEMINFNEINYTVIDFVVGSLCSSIRLRDNDSVLILFRRFSDFLYKSILRFEYDWSEYKVLRELQEKDPELPIEDCHKLEEQFFNQCVRKIARSLLTLIYISNGFYYNPEGKCSGWIYPHRYIPITNGEMPACASELIDRLYPLLYSKNGNVGPYHGVLIHSVPLELPEPDETEARFGMTLEQLRPVVEEYYISSRAAGICASDKVLEKIETKLSQLVKD